MMDFCGEVLIAGALVVVTLVMCLSPLVALDFYSACRSADIYNGANGTSWSCGDFFFAGSQINSQTQTINLNKQ